jgi:hypothetical protein
MAGHSNLHPFLKTYDECSRSLSRMNTYLNVFGANLSTDEREAVQTVIESLTEVLNWVPEQYHVPRKQQYKKNR